SAWETAAGGSVLIRGQGIQSTADDGSQVYIQNGIVGARNPNGSSLGHIGYHSETNRTFYHIQTSLGTNFAISARVGTSANPVRKTMLDIFPGSSETYIRTDETRITGMAILYKPTEIRGKLDMTNHIIEGIHTLNFARGGYID